jgi:hypothetical protein
VVPHSDCRLDAHAAHVDQLGLCDRVTLVGLPNQGSRCCRSQKQRACPGSA